MYTSTIYRRTPDCRFSRSQNDVLNGLPPGRRALVEHALSLPSTYVANGFFTNSFAERELFENGMMIDSAITDWYHPMLEVTHVVASRLPSRLLSFEEEKHLFLRYNYARWQTSIAVGRFRADASMDSAESILLWFGRANDTRDLIARANLALVLATARRFRRMPVEFGELISEGNLALLRAINAFDVSRGFKFSTYVCATIRKAFCRLASKAGRYRARFPTEYDPALERSDSQRTRRDEAELDAYAALRRILRGNGARLTSVEQTVIQNRFALQSAQDAPTMTLEQVSRVVGVTKERVRQIQNAALNKLRATLRRDGFFP